MAARSSRNVAAEYILGWPQQPVHMAMQAIATEHRKFSMDCPVEHGKTSQFLILDAMMTICERPEESGCVMGRTEKIPIESLKVVARHIEHNEKLQRVFPGIELVRSVDREMTVRRPATSTIKDPSLIALGLEGDIYGRRWTKWWTDDILGIANTWTPEARAKTWEILKQECFSRLVQWNPRTNIGGRHCDTGTPFHVEDARHKIQRLGDYGAFRFDGWTGDVINLKTGKVRWHFKDGLWPNLVEVEGRLFGWPRERLEALRGEDGWGEVEFNRAIRCIPLSGTLDVFRAVYIELCKIAGRGMWLQYQTERLLDGRVNLCWRPPVNNGDLILTGVDLAVSKKQAADRTVFHTIEVLPNGHRLPLEIRAGHMEAPEIARQLIWILDRYPTQRGFRVENNAAQDYILQIARNHEMMRAVGATDEHLRRLTVEAHTTTQQNKTDPLVGIRGMSVDFEQGKWLIPCDNQLQTHGLVSEWVGEMLAFDPTAHTGDILMATWLANEAARLYGIGRQRDGSMWSQHGVYVGG